MVDLKSTILLITSRENGWKILIKRQKFSHWKTKSKIQLYAVFKILV